jgi:hypothetical protein
MKIGKAFPSKHLKAEDLPDGTFVPVVIDRIDIQNVAGQGQPEEKKPVMFFRGKEKGLALNKTNANIISKSYGDETDDWIGKTITLYATETEFKGEIVPCIRVKVPKGTPNPPRETVANGEGQQRRPVAARASAPPAVGSNPFDEEPPSFENAADDDIPF